jgi:DNA modification methylase
MIDLRHGDCLEVLKTMPDKSVDLVVTDPPYLIETTGAGLYKQADKQYVKELNDIKDGFSEIVLDELCRVMKKINIYIWCNKKQIPDYLDFFVRKHDCSFEIMTWCKTNPVPLCGGNYLVDKEFCLYFRKGVKLNTTVETAFTYWISPQNKKDKSRFEHPTIKPINIIKTIIKNSSNDGNIVLDCFIGSGTTAIACKEIGRQFIGFEISEKWCKIANDRLNNIDAHGQMSLFSR